MSLVFDNATYFSSLKLYEFALENGIFLKHSCNYYPHGNGLVESTKKTSFTSSKRPFTLSNEIGTSLW